MSLSTDRERYLEAYRQRSLKTWASVPGTTAYAVEQWSDNILLVAAGPHFGSKIESLLEQVEIRDSFDTWTRPGPPEEILCGYYKGSKVTVLHTIVTPFGLGASNIDYGMERLRGTPGCRIVLVGEASSLQEHVRIGDLILPLSVVRDDDSHLSYAASDVPALADAKVSRCLVAAAKDTGRTVHTGVGWSCGAGAGIFDPCLVEKALVLNRMGVLGNTLEAATAYLLASVMNFPISSLWITADSTFEQITWHSPFHRLDWEEGWRDLVTAGLDSLISLERKSL